MEILQMERPVAVKIRNSAPPEVHAVSIDPAAAEQLRTRAKAGPAVVVTKEIVMLTPMSAGLIDADHVIAVSEGDWTNAVLVVLPAQPPVVAEEPQQVRGDDRFVDQVQRTTPALGDLAKKTLEAIRSAGVEGDLVEAGGGRWVNRPLNTFTLKAQPRVENLHFTIYGNPESFDAKGFLLQDQNSYSRGWVRNENDARRLANLARESHARRKR
jgi:hypothetical protein